MLIPVEELLNSGLNFDFVSPAEAVELGDINELTHGAVWLGGVEFDGAGEADGVDDKLGELTDGELFAGAYVDVAVADLTEGWDGSSSTGAVVAIDYAIGSNAIVDGRVFLESADVLEINVQKDMDGGIGHVFGPKELTQGCAGAPKGDMVVFDTIEGENCSNR